MEAQSASSKLNAKLNTIRLVPATAHTSDVVKPFDNTTDDFMRFFRHFGVPDLEDLFSKLAVSRGKKSFLVSKNNKYVNVLTENIAFFYIKYESPVIMCYDKQEYFVNYSLEQIQEMLPAKQFFRLNRQYLINFNVIKEVEHYFARKLLVKAVIPVKENLIVSRNRVSEFLHWLDNR
jgi:two-component system, LytTR family, response regulator